MKMENGTTIGSAEKICVALVDSVPLTRFSLMKFLSEHLSESVILPFATSQQILDGQASRPADLDLIIIHAGGRPIHEDESIHCEIEQLRAAMPEVPIVVFCDREDPPCVAEALTTGIRGYIPTAFDTQVLIGALRLVLAGGVFVPAGPILEALREKAPPVSLDFGTGVVMLEGTRGFTARQLEVLCLLKQGKSNKIIAHELSVEESTVKVHVRHIMKKLNATNRTHAVVLASQLHTDTG